MPSATNQTTTTEQPNMATASLKIMPQQMVKIKTKSMTLCPVMNTVPLKMSQLLMKTKHQPSRTAYKATKGSGLHNMATLQGSEARNISAGKHQKLHEPQRSRYGRALTDDRVPGAIQDKKDPKPSPELHLRVDK